MMNLGCVLTGWGTSLPPAVVTNQDMESLFDTSNDWIVERSGIHTRRAAAGPFAGQAVEGLSRAEYATTATLAAEAGRRALACAGISANDIGLLVLCTTTPDRASPATSAAVADALGVGGGAMDINAACAGFTYGLVSGAALVSIGAGKVLVIGADTLTWITNWEDRSNAFLFGDGAGAVVLEPVEGRGSLLGWDLGVDGSLLDLLHAEHGSTIVMRGKELFRKAVRATTDSARIALDRAGVDASEIDLFVPHQANQRIMDGVAARLDISSDRIASVIDWTGNTSAASIPLALVDAAERGRLKNGDLVLLAGFGAGMTWASAVWRWGTHV
jgi:3-oxoacyl-[acyl-carrier-protein] synthase-3